MRSVILGSASLIPTVLLNPLPIPFRAAVGFIAASLTGLFASVMAVTFTTDVQPSRPVRRIRRPSFVFRFDAV
jgi:hypothetical protein